jgi:hypothetical protein
VKENPQTPTDWPLPDEWLIELGRLAACWATFETMLDVYLGKVAGFDRLNDPRPYILLKHSSFPQKVDALCALCEQLSPQYSNLSGYKEVAGKIRAAQSARNRFIHNSIGQDPDTKEFKVAVGSARGKLKTELQSARLGDLRRAWREVNNAGAALHKLVTGKSLPPDPATRDA